jgi:hypothetical protein
MKKPSVLLRITPLLLCLTMTGCITVNIETAVPAVEAVPDHAPAMRPAPVAETGLDHAPATHDAPAVETLPNHAFNLVQNASGLCATIVQREARVGSRASNGLKLALCRQGALNQTFVQNSTTLQITSPAMPGTCLTSIDDHTDGTPRGHASMESCTKSPTQGWLFSPSPARLTFRDGMVLDASDPFTDAYGKPSWLGLPLKTWGASDMRSPNLDFSQRPVVN